MRLKRIVTTLSITAAGIAAAVLPGAPAQASVFNCSYQTLTGNENLELRVCATGSPDIMESTTWVRNKSNTANQYVQRLEITDGFGGYKSCQINAWLAPGVLKECTSVTYSAIMPSTTYMATGKIHYWSPWQNKYVVSMGYSAPVYVP